MSHATRGVVVGCLLAFAGCSPDLPDISAADADACHRLIAALPEQVADEDRSDDTARSAAWGGVELTCGVELPAAYDDFASCSVVGGVGWFLPPAQLQDPSVDIVATALTYSPRVSVLIPAEDRGTDAVQAAVAPAIRKTLTAGDPCL